MADNNSVINELRARRQMLALSASELATRSGIDEPLLCSWEHGNRSPSLDALQQWAAALGLKLSLLPHAEAAGRGIRVDWDKRRVTVDGAPVRLTPMEWRVIERLARTPGALVTHQELYRYVYGQDWSFRGQATAIRVLITKLRRLLPMQIDARWGQGYTLTGIEPPEPDRPAAEPPTAEPDPDAIGEPEPLNGASAPAAKAIPRGLPIRPSLLRTGDVTTRHALATAGKVNAGRDEELGVIERFLAERGVTRCPDVRTIEKAPLPALVWDKVKRKWVRPASEQLRTG
jgi:transcriptional regulator with XRE-family HTH domain